MNPRTGAPCATVAEQLAAWADGGLQGDAARQVAEHVRDCPTCAAEVADIRNLLGGLRDLATTDAPVRDPAFWQAMAAEISAQTQVVRPLRRSVGVPALAFAGMALAAALALFFVRGPTATAPRDGADAGSRSVAVADAGSAAPSVVRAAARTPAALRAPAADDPGETDPALLEDLGGFDDDPLDDIDELGDAELEALSRALGQGA